MHQALLIDEIVRIIFYYIHTSSGKTLPDVARCCKAWKDPALDRLWAHLTSIAPLFQLVSGIKEVSGMFVISGGVSSADLMVFMEYARKIKLFSLLASNAFSCKDAGILLPSLQVVRLSSSSCRSLQPSLCISRHVHIISARCRNLHVLSLRIGTTLTTDALQAIMAFPDLLELSIHAGHVDIKELQTIRLESQGANIFPALRKLDIRARIPLLEFLFRHIPAANTLQELSLEHHIELEEPEPNSEIFDTTIPPDVGDADIFTLVSWWPALQHLDLGSVSSPGIHYISKLTLACLPHIARKLPHLHSLILPIDASLVPPLIHSSSDRGSHALKRLTVTHPHNPDPSPVAQYIHRLFPYLLQLDGPIEQADQWTLTQAHMRMLRTFGTRRRSSSVMKTFHHH
ncbi:hypothetical protein BD779DRAFT_1511787 [Infundibulicybe gibba]|nr:hypothetical protein BD779DRAFT_1511787 [Infundibulicybe gibba]